MAKSINQIMYGIPPSASNIVDWEPTPIHTEVTSLSGEIDRMMTLTRPESASVFGNIQNGDPVILNDNGTITRAGKIPNTVTEGISADTDYAHGFDSVYDPDTGQIVFSVTRGGSISPEYIKAYTATVSGNDMTFGGINEIETRTASSVTVYSESRIVYDSTNQCFVIVWFDKYAISGRRNKMAVGKIVASTDLTFGSIQIIQTSGYSDNHDLTYDPSNGLVLWQRVSGNTGYTKMYTVNSTALSASVGQETIFDTGVGNVASVYDPDTQKIVTLYGKTDLKVYSIIGTVTTTSPAISAEITYTASPTEVGSTSNAISPLSIVYDSSNKRVVAFFHQADYGYCAVGTVDGDTETVSWGTPVQFSESSVYYKDTEYDPINEQIWVHYTHSVGGVNYPQTRMGIINMDTEQMMFYPEEIYISDNVGNVDIVYNPPTEQMVTTVLHSNALDYSTFHYIHTPQFTNLTLNNWLGVAQTPVGGTEMWSGGVDVWTPYGTNDVLDTGNGIKITYVDNSLGAYVPLSAGALTENLIHDEEYLFTAEFKITEGGLATPLLEFDVDDDEGDNITSTDWVRQTWRFRATDSDFDMLSFKNMGTGESVWIRNMSMKHLDSYVVGRYGFLDKQQSGLLPGRAYYVDGYFGFVTNETFVYAGLAITDTNLLLKG